MIQSFVNVQFITVALTFVGVLVIGAMKYYERKVAGSTETWDNAKFGMFVLVAGIVMIVEYSATGGWVFPADTTLEAILTMLNPIFVIFGAAYAAIIGGKLVKNTVVIPTYASIKQGAVAAPLTVSPVPAYGKARVLGIYGGSARGAEPKPSWTCDVNMVPTMFFDAFVTEAGDAAMKLIIDGVAQKKWMPDMGSTEAEQHTTFTQTQVGTQIPYSFMVASNYRTTGNHSIIIQMGYYDSTGTMTTWVSSNEYTLILTGTKYVE